LDDGYLGSGNLLKRAIKKHGRENFAKEIIADYPTRKEASDHEKIVVTIELAELDECYNLRSGGDNEYAPSEQTKKRLREINTGKKLSNETKEKMGNFQRGRPRSEEYRNKISVGLLGEKHPMFGKTHSEETRAKMSNAHAGDKNHQFGKFNNDPRSRKCIILQVEYVSRTEAARQLNINVNTVRYRLSSTSDTFKDWKYCE